MPQNKLSTTSFELDAHIVGNCTFLIKAGALDHVVNQIVTFCMLLLLMLLAIRVLIQVFNGSPEEKQVKYTYQVLYIRSTVTFLV